MESSSRCSYKNESKCDTSKQGEDVKQFLEKTVRIDGKTSDEKDGRLLSHLLRLLELHVKHKWKTLIILALAVGAACVLSFVLIHWNRSEVLDKSSGPIPKTIFTVKEGGNIYVKCRHQTHTKANTWWTWNTPGSTFYQPIDLNITNIQRWQAGEYFCHVRGDSWSDTVEKVIVDVHYPCDVVSFSINPQQTKENDVWRMECNATGNPTPSLQIFNNDTGAALVHPTEAVNSDISKSANCLDTGLYLCTCSNDLNANVSSKKQRMEVLCAPRPDHRYGSYDTQSYTANVGEDLNITLYYMAYPYPNFTWTHQGYDIVPEERADIRQRDTVATKLMLTNLQFDDFGDYVIDVINDQGSSQALVRLFGEGPPQPPTNLQVHGLYDYVVVKWYSGFDNFLNQTFLLKYRKDSEGSEWSVVDVPDLTKQHWNASVAYLLGKLEIGSLYHFTVSARNDDGQESNSSNTIPFRTHVPAGNTITVLEGKPLNVKCSNTIMPDADTWWTWNVTARAFLSNESSLFLRDTRRSQAGQYLCIARVETTGQNGTISTNLIVDTVTVDVQYPCDIVSFSIRSKRVKENDPWSIQCNVMGNPDPTFMIRNNDTGKVIKEETKASNFSASFDQASCLDNGLYVCTGYNRLNTGNATKSQVLEVLCVPRPDHRYPIQNNVSYAARVGDDVTVSFHFLAFPAPQITWSHPGSSKTPGIQLDKTVRGTHVTTLTFKRIQPDEFGQYVVQVHNSQGYAPPKFAFISGAEGPPEAPTNLEVVGGSYYYVALKWNSGFDYFRKQTFLLKYKQPTALFWSTVKVPDTTDQHNLAPVTYILKNLQPNTYYIFTVSATNEKGQESAPITVYSKTEAKPHTNGSKRHTNSLLAVLPVLHTLGYMFFVR